MGIAQLDFSNPLAHGAGADGSTDERYQRATVLAGGERGLTIRTLYVRQPLDTAIVTDKRKSGKGLVRCSDKSSDNCHIPPTSRP